MCSVYSADIGMFWVCADWLTAVNKISAVTVFDWLWLFSFFCNWHWFSCCPTSEGGTEEIQGVEADHSEIFHRLLVACLLSIVYYCRKIISSFYVHYRPHILRAFGYVNTGLWNVVFIMVACIFVSWLTLQCVSFVLPDSLVDVSFASAKISVADSCAKSYNTHLPAVLEAIFQFELV